ncbi:hypothetical protein ACTFIZ_008946 [Dictyostelium cf. discoideum]
MRSILILLSLFLTIAFKLATFPYQCGPHSCQFGQICRIDKGVFSLSTKVIGTWVDGSHGNKRFTQYDITITNNLNTNIKQIYLDNDYTLRLRDHSNNSIWNVNLLPNGILTLTSYQPSINAHASFTFGFVLEGTCKFKYFISFFQNITNPFWTNQKYHNKK